MKDQKLLQIIPLADRPAQYGNHVIALALLEEAGTLRMVYVFHDPVSGRPVIKNN